MHQTFRNWRALILLIVLALSHRTMAAPTTQEAAAAYDRLFTMLDGLAEPNHDAPLNEATIRFLEENEELFALLHEVAAMPEAGPDAKDDAAIDLATKRLSGFRRLANLSALRTRYLMSINDHSGAANELYALFAIGRHAGQAPLLICKLVELAITELGAEKTAACMLAWPAELQRDFARRLEGLPRSVSLAEMFRGEQKYAANMLRDLKMANAAAVEQAMAPFYDAAVAALDLPIGDFEPALKKAAEAVGQANPAAGHMTKLLYPSQVAFRLMAARGSMHLPMVRAALLIAADGPAAGEAIVDPVWGEPFLYSANENGFTLTTAAEIGGKEMTLRFTK